MLLFASALDKEEILDKLVESCMHLMKNKTVALAIQEFNNQFESHGLNKVSFLTGYTVN